ncbi:hypothetical protein EW146_g6294 [Bondarzewia mesenterica]|uniref:DUF6532 domain-containing protein n=1 Tax=Bondarzewia mesenterica TaxID=1095465 RepID=A0A4S4LPL5_9AGAM|nr:hypothetical protein EW146_g6294 [Bondarzewia mesenterica]
MLNTWLLRVPCEAPRGAKTKMLENPPWRAGARHATHVTPKAVDDAKPRGISATAQKHAASPSQLQSSRAKAKKQKSASELQIGELRGTSRELGNSSTIAQTRLIKRKRYLVADDDSNSGENDEDTEGPVVDVAEDIGMIDEDAPEQDMTESDEYIGTDRRESDAELEYLPQVQIQQDQANIHDVIEDNQAECGDVDDLDGYISQRLMPSDGAEGVEKWYSDEEMSAPRVDEVKQRRRLMKLVKRFEQAIPEWMKSDDEGWQSEHEGDKKPQSETEKVNNSGEEVEEDEENTDDEGEMEKIKLKEKAEKAGSRTVRRWPIWTEVIVPDRRGRWSISDQDRRVHKVLTRTASKELPKILCFENAFPLADIRGTLLRSALVRVATELGQDVIKEQLLADTAYVEVMGKIPEGRMSNFCLDLKKITMKSVKTSYELAKIPVNKYVAILWELLKEPTYLYIFPGRIHEIHSTLDGFKLGLDRTKVDLRTETYVEHYRNHMATLKQLRDEDIEVYHDLMAHLY